MQRRSDPTASSMSAASAIAPTSLGPRGRHPSKPPSARRAYALKPELHPKGTKEHMSTYQAQLHSPSRLASMLEGKIVIPQHARFDEARQAWNLAVDQRPAAVVFPESTQDVAAAILFAREFGQQVAAQGTGHNAGPLGSLEDTILLKTERMRRVTIDPVARTARVEAGALWLEVVEAAAQHGLAALAGSSPDVGVVGYTLGGGVSFLGRKYGLAANAVRAIELVTADGSLVRADRDDEPDLFWALRGGGGSFGIVTALELDCSRSHRPTPEFSG